MSTLTRKSLELVDPLKREFLTECLQETKWKGKARVPAGQYWINNIVEGYIKDKFVEEKRMNDRVMGFNLFCAVKCNSGNEISIVIDWIFEG